MDGKSHYADGLYQEAEKVLGIDKRTAEDLKMISERFQITERSVNVTWSHHRQVASLKTIEEDEKAEIKIRAERRAGEMLRDSERHYADGLYQEAEKVLGWAQTSLRDLKYIADQYEMSLRNDKLTWNHHKEVASLKTIEEDEKGKDNRTACTKAERCYICSY